MRQLDSKFTFIDLFAGIGGMRLAFEKAGGTCVFSSEWNKFCQETYRANFGETPEGDITSIPASHIPDHDILLAGFPCQPFSIAGVSKKSSLNRPHGFEDETQGTLFFDIARIISEKKPKAFLLENVKNLQSHDNKRTFDIIIRTLREKLGYDVHYEVIDAKNVVPQHRERIFIVGFLHPVEFEFPKIKEKYLKVSDIMEKKVDEKYTLTDGVWAALKRHSANSRKKGNGFGYGMTNLEGIARTLSARYYKDGAEILIPQGKDKNPRRLTPRECARIMGFPETFQVVVSDTQAYRQFGNSVVVPLVTKIAKSVAKHVENKKEMLVAEYTK